MTRSDTQNPRWVLRRKAQVPRRLTEHLRNIIRIRRMMVSHCSRSQMLRRILHRPGSIEMYNGGPIREENTIFWRTELPEQSCSGQLALTRMIYEPSSQRTTPPSWVCKFCRDRKYRGRTTSSLNTDDHECIGAPKCPIKD